MVGVEPLLRLLKKREQEEAESDGFLSDSLDGEHTTNLQEML